MNKTAINCLILGAVLTGLPITAVHAAQCKQGKGLNASTTYHRVIYRHHRPMRTHTAYYCPDNGMHYPQTLGCMGTWVVVQR